MHHLVYITSDFNAHCNEWLESEDTNICGNICGEKFSKVLNVYSLEQAENFLNELSLWSTKSVPGSCHNKSHRSTCIKSCASWEGPPCNPGLREFSQG